MQHTATYSPEDNKIRVYPSNRLDDELGEEYAEFKRAGFKWASKQECFVCPRWTPKAEDWALKLACEIEDEDYSPLERSADRAERFGNYRDKRRAEATEHADTFEAGPSAFGHQNRERAERQAARLDRQRVKAVSQWSKAEYWQRRTEGVISHALYRAKPEVRRERIRRLEADQRKHLKELEECRKRREMWQHVADCEDQEKATAAAISIAGNFTMWHDFAHPDDENEKHSLYSLLQPYDADRYRPITGKEAAELYLSLPDPDREGSYSRRWSAHYELRLSYENAMLANEGGQAGDVEMVPGGWIVGRNRHQIIKVNKSPATGRVTSVTVLAPSRNNYDRNGKAFGEDNPRPIVEVKLDVTRLGEDCYQAPTEEELKAFKADREKKKAEAKANKPKQPKLINPTDEDAGRLQAILNDKARKKFDQGDNRYSTFEPAEVTRMTQAKYSHRSRGDYSTAETREIHNFSGILAPRKSNMWSQRKSDYIDSLGPAVCKIRIADSSGFNLHSPPRIVILTDKPQKPLPLDWDVLGCDKDAASKEQAELF